MKKVVNFSRMSSGMSSSISSVSFGMGYALLLSSMLFFGQKLSCNQKLNNSKKLETEKSKRVVSKISQIKDSEIKKSKIKDMSLQIRAAKRVKMPLGIYYLQSESNAIEPLVFYLEKAFQFSGQCTVVVKKVAEKPSKKSIGEFFGTESPLALFMLLGDGHGVRHGSAVSGTSNEDIGATVDGDKVDGDKVDGVGGTVSNGVGAKQSIELYLFNTLDGKIIFQKRCTKTSGSIAGWAYRIGDLLWPVLTGQAGLFCSKIAYCKQVDLAQGKRAKHICIADYDGSNEQTVVDLPTISIAPRWNNDLHKPLIFYSEYTNNNIRLMFVDMKKNRRIASDYDGINMLPAFSKDGKKVVYCASHGNGLCQLYYGENGVFKTVAENSGNNISPSFIDDTNILFCSDFQTGSPQIYTYNRATKLVEKITEGGYCTSPSYSATRNCIAYSKMEKGQAQIYLYDMKKKMNTCLTSGKGSKLEPSWSPCGNYLVFSLELGNKSRIGIFNMFTKETSLITPESVSCSYPSWSQCYIFYPSL